jgi:RND superfamily putative drug exporter
MFEALGRFSFRRRWTILAAALASVAVAVVWGMGVFDAMSGDGFADPDSESARAAEVAAEHLGRDDADVIVLYSSETSTVEDRAFQRAVESALTFRPDQGVTDVATFWSTGSRGFVSADGTSTFAVLQLAGATEDERAENYAALESELRRPVDGLTVSIGGDVPLDEDLGEQAGEDIARAELLSLPLVLLLLLIVFRGLVAASLPLVVGTLAVLGSFTLLRVVTLVTDVSVFSINVITMLGLGLAIDYALFIVSRFREEMRATPDVEHAMVRTLATAGRTVAFSALTVAISLASLLLFPQVFLRSMGLGGIAAVLIAMVGALTVLPALLAVLGRRVDALRLPALRPRPVGRHRAVDPGAWYRIATSVMRRPVVYVAVIVPALLVLGAPFFSVVFGSVDYRALPEGLESRVVAERLAEDFPSGGRDTIDAVLNFDVPADDPAAQEALATYVDTVAALPGVTSADVTGVGGNAARVSLQHELDPQSVQARELVSDVRAVPPPEGATVLVAGPTAQLVDLLAGLRHYLPWMILSMVLATLLLLFLAFGSVVLPVKAVIMNVLSLSASFGALVWVFQDGNFSGLLGFTPTGTIEATQPILMLAIAFGLSMDYEVFLLSRIREQWDHTHDNAAAVASGLQSTGGIITSAALLLVVVFGAFATSGLTFLKMIGVGMVLAIIIDATVVRTLLVPASMRLMGNANWWAPRPLVRFWERYGLRESGLPPTGAPTPPVVGRRRAPARRGARLSGVRTEAVPVEADGISA